MNPFKGRHFQRDIILWAVRWYCKYGISYRELQEMLAVDERGACDVNKEPRVHPLSSIF
ncbi:transposase for IS26 [Klebsiella pneumoniae]|nr:transposase for IS26 [Klebsiella pneumoniae]